MPLQKSFSEQARYQKKQTSWQRSKTLPATSTTAASRPPILVSSVTKKKLEKFQFNHAHQGGGPDLAKDVVNASRTGGYVEGAGDATDDKGKASIEATPHGRIAWNELLETPAARSFEDEITPTDRLMWDDSLQAATVSPLVSRRGKKRARSSSPTSPPSCAKPQTPAINVKKLAQALMPTQTDPAMDLWDRFATGANDEKAPSRAINPALAHLMVSSSPRPPRETSKVNGDSGFRRSFSDGLQWPKRRRIEASTPSKPSRSQHDVESKSMVSALLDVMTGDLKKALQPMECDKEDQAVRKNSPVKHWSPRKESPRKLSPRKQPEAHMTTSTPVVKRQGRTIETPSSNYGDDDFDDFDDDTLMELDASIINNVSNATSQVLTIHETNDESQDCMKNAAMSIDGSIIATTPALACISPKKAGNVRRTSQRMSPSKRSTAHNMQKDAEEDDYGDPFDEDFDFEAVELAATQSLGLTSSAVPRPSQKARAIQRYLVTTVLHTSYRDASQREHPEVVLVVQAERTNAIKTVHLRGDWADTPVSTKSYVHIIGEFEPAGHCIVDNNQNLLILHPDQLISATVVADSFSCMRRAVLQDRVKATSESSDHLVYGTILHEIFQEALLANRWDSAFLGSAVDDAMAKHLEDLYIIKKNSNVAREDLLTKLKELQCWAEKFMSSFPRRDAMAHGRKNEKTNLSVSKLLDIEEHVWSPMYGLKGNIDATVQVTVNEGRTRRNLTVPLELKTGKNVSENHQAQTMLYNLLLSDRYDIEIAYGILYYMESSLTKIIPSIRNELRHMIKQRNNLACHIRERSVQLPPMKKSKHACGSCYAQASCFIYHKLADDGDGESSGLKDRFDQAVKHLTPTHRDFFLKWENLLTKEEKESHKLRRELWTMLSSEREKLGRCFGNVVIEEGSASEDVQTRKINRFHYTFVKPNPPAGFSFMESQLAVGEPIVVSDEQGHFALALGFVTSVRKQRIAVAVDRRLHNARIRQPGFDETDNQVFASIMEVAPEGSRPEDTQGRMQMPPIRYRLDKDEFSNGMALVRNNLVQIMTDSVAGSSEIRRLVVDLEAPQFKTVSTQYTIHDKANLNVDQKKAVEKVMSAKDYALVLGMPGTGKTTTVANIIRALVLQGKSVLLTSYTHTAVDNILLKLKDDDMSILRLGAPAKVHPEVQDFAILAGRPMESFEEIRSAWHDTPVVATTCLGVNHALFNERTFDYCIVDEASQITLPICLGPLRMAKTFVLVGDHNQLPPLVQNEDARKGGLDISLFKLLSDTHPQSVVNLEHQYRMSEDIMTLSNTLIYHGRLKCGTQELRSRVLEVPDLEALTRHHHEARSSICGTHYAQKTVCNGSKCWLRDAIQSSTRVSFLNADSLPDSNEEAKGNRIVNHAEARIATQLVESLLTVGVPASEIGIMTHYRSQLSVLKHSLRNLPQSGNIEMHTADRFQGRDKEVIILSLVRSNEACNIGDLLKDWRRINVAFTRAKSKLLVIGSRSTLKGCGKDEMLAKFVRLMEEKQWVYDLPANALESHFFHSQGIGTQATTAGTRSPVKSQAGCGWSTSQKRAISAVKSPGNVVRADDKENTGLLMPKKTVYGSKNVVKGKPVLRDVLNEMTNGMY